MDILQLRYFSEVYDTLNYSRAAEALFISRQALRQVVHNLETELGQPLFVSVKNNLRATSAADTLYGASRPVLGAFHKFENNVNEAFQEQRQPTLRCGIISNIHEIFTKEEIEECHTRDFHVHMSYVSGSCEQLRQMVLDGSLDTAILFSNRTDDARLQISCNGKQGQLYLMVNRRHPLSKKKSINIYDLQGQPFISKGKGYDLHDLIVSECKKSRL